MMSIPIYVFMLFNIYMLNITGKLHSKNVFPIGKNTQIIVVLKAVQIHQEQTTIQNQRKFSAIDARLSIQLPKYD